VIRIERYDAGAQPRWNAFVATARNGVFLFDRRYMDYHADRFVDASLMVYEDDELVGLLPANLAGDTVVSHAGLTFGGVVCSARMKTSLMVEVFDALVLDLRQRGIAHLIYKAVPHIYHTQPSEEDLYALFRHGARLRHRDVSATIDRRAPLPWSKGRRSCVKRARTQGVVVKPAADFRTFMAIEEENLKRHQVKPVHSADEIALLASRFPDRIGLHGAFLGDRMLGGVIMYASDNVAHAQYISATDEGRELGAVDLVLDVLINDRYAAWRYFDFGISTERGGAYLNEGLAQNKESFGARTTVYDSYELDVW
jgi:hypothetical protein